MQKCYEMIRQIIAVVHYCALRVDPQNPWSNVMVMTLILLRLCQLLMRPRISEALFLSAILNFSPSLILLLLEDWSEVTK